MDSFYFRLEPIFGTFPEPVIFLLESQMVYLNEAGSALLQDEGFSVELLLAVAEHPGDSIELADKVNSYRVTVSPYEGGSLVVLRPQEHQEEKKHPFSDAVYRMRENLSNLTAVQWRLRRQLRKKKIDVDIKQDLASQSKFIYQMLRLVRQTELTEDLNQKTFPREEGFDLALVCSGLANEMTWLADMAGVRFSYRANVGSLPFQGSKSLITQMLLSLTSNGVRAAGNGGVVEMRLHTEGNRCVITVKDTGMGIPGDRMATLFSGEPSRGVPRPGEGAGLGLYNARRIAILHGGVVIAQSGQDGGTSLAVSLPIVTPASVPARNNPGYDNLGGYSPVLIELSDVLPWETFVPTEDED